MDAWQKREMELRGYVEIWERDLIHDEEGEFLSDLAILERCHELLGVVIGEIKGDDKTVAHVNIFATNSLTKGFSRTSAEAMILKKWLIEKLITAGFHDAEAEHLRQKVHEPEKLYAGHRAMDKVD